MCQFPLCLFRSFCLCYNNDDFKTTLMMPSSSLLNATQNAIQIAPQKSLFPNINRKCYRPLITFVNVSCRLHRCNHLPLMMRRCCVKPTSHLHVLLCVSLGHPHQYGDLLTRHFQFVESPFTWELHCIRSGIYLCFTVLPLVDAAIQPGGCLWCCTNVSVGKHQCRQGI